MSLQIFQANLFKQSYVEHILIDDEPWFKAKQVADILDYANTRQAIQAHVDEEDKKPLNAIYQESENKTADILGNTIMINESGLYSLILRSKKKEAKEFKKWITSEVIPSIRRTGRYENMELRRQLEESKKIAEKAIQTVEKVTKTVEKQDKLIDWYMDHQVVEDRCFQKLPPKKMEYIPAPKQEPKKLDDIQLKKRIVADMRSILSNPYDYIYIPRN